MAEDFTEKDSDKVIKQNFKSVGKSGTLVTGFTVQEDYIDTLNGNQAQEVYHRMLLSDPTIRKLVHSVNNPIKSAEWSIKPASDDAKDLEVAALIEQILFRDLPEGWKAKLDEILTFPWQGHSVFEIIHKNRENKSIGTYTGLANLSYRDQRTLDEWHYTPEGILEKIHQKQSGDIEVDAFMEADTLLLFFNEKKGSNTGYPFCRMLYGNWKRKKLEKELQIIGIEKGAIGVPKLTLPKGVDFDSLEYAHAVEQLENYVQAESAFIILPDGYILELDQNSTFDPAKVQAAIKAENEEIAGSLVAMWLEMGIGGNSAVGASTGISADFFRDGIEYLADKIAEPFNLRLIPHLVKLNYGDTVEVMPELKHNGIADEAGRELMEVVTGYVEKGVLTPDPILEDHVRAAHNLPKKAEGEAVETKSATSTEEEGTPPAPKAKEVEEELELSEKGNPKTPKALMKAQAVKISDIIRENLTISSGQYINKVINRYNQLPDAKKQTATSTIEMGGSKRFKKDLKRVFTETMRLAIEMAAKEVPVSDVQLSSKESDMTRMREFFGDISDIKLNDFSKLPAHIQVLIAKQSDLISKSSMEEIKNQIDFAFSGNEVNTSDDEFLKQVMEDKGEDFIESNRVAIKGDNSSALMVNEGRSTYFYDDDVLDEVHSFTFVNASPKSAICQELAGTTFKTNDVESLRYSPPLHHNCKSYLRANLKSSQGVNQLDVSSLSPSAKAKKSITL